MSELNLKHEAKRYGCAVLAAMIMALNIKTFVRAGGLFPGGFTGLTLLIQNIFQTFVGIAVPYTLINVLLNSIPVFIGLKFIGKKFTISSVCVIVLSGLLTDIIPSQPITYDTLLISIFGGLINGFCISLCLIGNTSTGGTDFIAIYFSEKSGRDIWNYILCGNAVILTVAGLLFGWDQSTLLHHLPVYLHSGNPDAPSEIQETHPVYHHKRTIPDLRRNLQTYKPHSNPLRRHRMLHRRKDQHDLLRCIHRRSQVPGKKSPRD